MNLQKRTSFTLTDSNQAHIDELYLALCERHQLISGQSVVFIDMRNNQFYVTLTAKSNSMNGQPPTSVSAHGEHFNFVVSEAFRKLTAKIASEKARRSRREKRSNLLADASQ